MKVYTGSCSSWEIIDVIGNNPVLLVRWIKTLEENKQAEQKIITWENIQTTYIWWWIDVNVDGIDNLQVVSSWSIIKIISWSVESWVLLLQIEPFNCSADNYLTNCGQLKKSFEENWFKKLVNDNQVTFWKMPEQARRMVFSDIYGYNIIPFSWNFLQLVNTISLKDNSKLIEETILSTCASEENGIKLTSIIKKQKKSKQIHCIW